MKKDKGGNGSPRKKGRAFDFSKCCSRSAPRVGDGSSVRSLPHQFPVPTPSRSVRGAFAGK